MITTDVAISWLVGWFSGLSPVLLLHWLSKRHVRKQMQERTNNLRYMLTEEIRANVMHVRKLMDAMKPAPDRRFSSPIGLDVWINEEVYRANLSEIAGLPEEQVRDIIIVHKHFSELLKADAKSPVIVALTAKTIEDVLENAEKVVERLGGEQCSA